jgi:hypothetical protein
MSGEADLHMNEIRHDCEIRAVQSLLSDNYFATLAEVLVQSHWARMAP